MADESLLPGNLDLSSIPDAPKPRPPLAGLDTSSIPGTLKSDEYPGYVTESDPLTSCIIALRKSITRKYWRSYGLYYTFKSETEKEWKDSCWLAFTNLMPSTGGFSI